MSKSDAQPALAPETVLDLARQLGIPIANLNDASRIAAGAYAAVAAVRAASSGSWDGAEPEDFDQALRELAPHDP